MRISRHQSLIVSRSLKKGAFRADPARHISGSSRLSGSVHMLVLGILMAVFVASGGYLYSVNRSAVQGYHLRTLEKEIGKLKQENAELRIAEADLRSLYRIKASGEELRMEQPAVVKYLEERGPIALR